MIQIAVLSFALLGLALSALLFLMTVGLVKPAWGVLPAFCRLGEGECTSLLHSADARLFGIPNVVVGMLYYGALTIVALGKDVLNDLIGFLVLVGAFTVIVGIYLSLRLLIVRRVRCMLCFANHLVNVALFAIFLLGL